MRDGELGAFLRARREALSPADVGLPAGSRRRTPGLRRAELAMLAGVSVEYLARLEQGRDRRPSPSLLAALADALRLGKADVDHLNNLATISNGPELCRHARRTARTVRPETRAILAQLEPNPCYVVNHLADVLAWTDGYARLMRPLGLFETEAPNLAWFTFAEERARAAHPDWAELADQQVAALHELRWGDPAVDDLAAALTSAAGEEFSRRWETRPLGSPRSGVRALEHPEIGALRLNFETLEASDDDQRLVVMLPADRSTAARLRDLNEGERGAGSADGLRPVGTGQAAG
ncbi:helix-turn-helix domain-containing protein [Streptomyces profundus]|uniref:helix-turn-helix domain-containing protein n=1 Tax=Streptomyces profundus TaxID=2867410 RepID=UPI001D166BCE|nr:helix-turn-helix transcriptional regulator [Streptomyces sp. MA3_2.13]UED85163.1 helix-turn-helix transcriptional regulator [Streptomyces sp. MA3_2.13]